MATVLIHEWVTGGGLFGTPLPGSWAAEGSAMRRAIAREFAGLPGVQVIMTLDERLPEEAGPWKSVRVGADEPRVFGRLAAGADHALVIAPETGGVLAERAEIIERVGGNSLGSTRDAVELAADKYAFRAHLAARGIATPACRLVNPATGLPPDHPYPAVLKPRDGAGSVDTFLVGSVLDVPEPAKRCETALLQPFEAGTPLSASFLVDASGRVRLIGVGRQRIAVEAGRLTYQGGRIPAPRAWLTPNVTEAAESVPGLRGFVGVDFLYESAGGRGTVIELNPRPTTSVVGLLRLLPPGRLARAWLGEPGDLAALVHSSSPVTFDADGTTRLEKG